MSLLPHNFRNQRFLDALGAFSEWPSKFFSLEDFDSLEHGLNVYEDKNNNLIIEAEVPGFKEDEISINLKNGVLWIEATKQEEQKDRTYIKKSKSVRSYRYDLPPSIDDKVEPEASIRDGIVEITFHKGKNQESKKIPLKKKDK